LVAFPKPEAKNGAEMAIVSTIAKCLPGLLRFGEDSQFSHFHVRKPDAGFNLESGCLVVNGGSGVGKQNLPREGDVTVRDWEKHSGGIPDVSVIIPVYRGSQYIAQALTSVFSQRFTAYEVIVVNDGSPEAEQVERELHPYAQQITYIKQENGGPSSARNAGILQAKGEYVAFLDCDDAWHPSYLAEQLALLRADPELDLIYCDALLIGASPNAGKTVMEINPSRGAVSLESLLKLDCSVITSCTVVRRQCLLDAGLFDKDRRCCEDYDMWVRIANRGGRMTYQHKVLAFRRIHSQAITADPSYVIDSQVAVFRKLGASLPLIPLHQAIVQKQIARCMAEIHLHRSKADLMAGKYSEAASGVRFANDYFQSRKLRSVEWIIRHMPRTVRLFYRTRNRWYSDVKHKKFFRPADEVTFRR
jgi:glycosyltransferase involved in cell wall biosynthesis